MAVRWKLKWCLLAISVPLLVGCFDREGYNSPKFKSIEDAKFQLLTEDQLWGGPSKIFKYGDLVAVICYGFEMEPTWLHLFTKDGAHLADMVHYGRGPKEALSLIKAYMRDGCLYMLDLMQHKMLVADLSRISEDGYSAVSSRKMLKDNYYFYVEKLAWGDTLYLHDVSLNPNVASKPRLELVAEDGTISAICEETPFADLSAAERSYLEFAAMSLCVSPDGEHIALATGTGAILETFSFSSGKIKSLAVNYYVEPQYDVSKNGITLNDKSMAGFGYMHSTNDRIYAAYDGETLYNDESKMLFKNIAVFDWKGNALKEIRTDYRISSLYTDDGKEFYAVVEDKDRRPYVARLVVE